MRIGGGFHFGFSIADDIATAERKKRAGRLTDTAKKNIKIERKTAEQLPAKKHTVEKTHVKTAPVETAPPDPKPEPKKAVENLDLDLEDLDD